MVKVTSYTAARIKAIQDASIVSAQIVGGNLLITRGDGSEENLGSTFGDTEELQAIADAMSVATTTLASWTAGELDFVNNQTDWMPLPNNVGTNLDLVVENAFEGQWVDLYAEGFYDVKPANVWLNMLRVVDDVPTTSGTGAGHLVGQLGWIAISGIAASFAAWVPYQITEDDISSDGSVTFRPAYKASGDKRIWANTGAPFTVGVRSWRQTIQSALPDPE